MARTGDRPLFSPTATAASAFPCKALLFALSLAGVICAIALISVHLTSSTGTTLVVSPLRRPSTFHDLCARSPSPSSCNDVVSEAMLASGEAHDRSPSRVFRAIARKSSRQVDAALAAASDRVLHQKIRDARQQAALADCVQLLGLSLDRILASDKAVERGAATDARTWMSSVLTNHGTCLDGLDGAAKLALEGRLEALRAAASASLAVLNAVPASDEDDVGKPVIEFPSWVSHYDRKLLEVPSAGAIQADAVVAKDGSGKFSTVQAAVDSVPDGNKKRFVIYVKKGVYKENVSLGKKKTMVMLVGDGMDATVITGSLNVDDGSTTFNSATLAAVGDGLILQDLKIENTAGPEKHQAVALRVGADQSVINRCRVDAYQDTLYAHSLRQFYRDSYVSGTVDFIFGNAAVVFQNSSLVARKPMSNQQTLVTAQGRDDPNQNTGTSVQRCQVVPSADLKGAAIKSYLGRPWKAYSRTVFMQSFVDSHIDPKGWLEWSGDFALSTLYYGEYQNKGPGAGTAGRVTWPGYHVITDANVAKDFTVASLIQGGSWLKDTGVAFTEVL